MTIQPTIFWVEDSAAYIFNAHTQRHDLIHYKVLHALIEFQCPISKKTESAKLTSSIEDSKQILEISEALHQSLTESVTEEIRFRTFEAECLAKLQHIEQEILDSVSQQLEGFDIPVRVCITLDSKSPVRSKRLFLRTPWIDDPTVINDLYRNDPPLYQLSHGMFQS